MENLSQYLTNLKVQLNDILLDPNNPRFAELDDVENVIPESRFEEPKIQREAFEKMKTDRFEVSELRDTIKTIGFLPMDKVVVRLWKASPDLSHPKYVVVEGNRRITALKWLLDLHSSARETFSDEQITNFTSLDVLLFDQSRAPDSAMWILPGLRHVSGIKGWGPYQKARAVYTLRESGIGAQESAQSLGLSTKAANALWRSYLALQQMKDDEEYGEYAEPKRYSYFEEIFKKPDVRIWLDWSDADRKFKHASHLREMYSWIVGEQDDEGELQHPKLPEAKSIREFSPLLNDQSAMAVFRSTNGSLTRALARYEADHPEDWEPTIVKSETMLSGLSPDSLRSLNTNELAALNKLKDRIEKLFNDREKLMN